MTPSKINKKCFPPTIDLEEAIGCSHRVYRKAPGRPATRSAVAHFIGYSCADSASAVIASLKKYELLVNDKYPRIRLSSDAIKLINGTDQRQRLAILWRMLLSPLLYAELFAQFGETPSKDEIMTHLMTCDFEHHKAVKILNCYMSSLSFVRQQQQAYTKATTNTVSTDAGKKVVKTVVPPSECIIMRNGFTLPEGPVTLALPHTMSANSFSLLTDWLILQHRSLRECVDDPNTPELQRSNRQ